MPVIRSVRRGARSSWLVLVVLAVGACSHRPADSYYPPTPVYDVQPAAACADSAPHLLPPARMSDSLSLAAAMGRDQRDAWLARRIPGGWASGPWASNDRVAFMWMRDPSQKRAAIAALDSASVPNAGYQRADRPDSVVALDIAWDAAELYDWMYYLLQSRDHAPLRGVAMNGWGVDTRRGRILFGIERLETIPRLAAWLGAVGAPCNLVAAMQMGPITLTGATAGLSGTPR